MSAYQPKTGTPCTCRKGTQRDNCPACEGTGQRIDFAAVRARGSASRPPEPAYMEPMLACVLADVLQYMNTKRKKRRQPIQDKGQKKTDSL